MFPPAGFDKNRQTAPKPRSYNAVVQQKHNGVSRHCVGLGFAVILAATIAAPAYATEQPEGVTVEQMTELLSQLRGEKDAKVARRLSDLKLTQRVSAVRLAEWDAEFPGKRTRSALTEIADASAFLDLPASDIPDQAAPDLADLQQILIRSITYVNKTTRELPDFYALRTTTSFENAIASFQDHYLCETCVTPAINAGKVKDLESKGLRTAGRYHAIVTYVDGNETDNGRGPTAKLLAAHGLVTVGEFGPILSVVLGDAVRGKIFWSHWEKGPTGFLATFGYSVPQAGSHYLVSLPPYLFPMSAGLGLKSVRPAYHGEIAIDPQDGAIYRIMIIANPDAQDPNVETAMMVRYSPVAIGGKSYICPVQGVALSEVPVNVSETAQPEPIATRLNDITFTRYHLFRAEVKILPDAGENSPAAALPAPSAH